MKVTVTQPFRRQEEHGQTDYAVGDVIENAGTITWALEHGFGARDAKAQKSPPENKAKSAPRTKGTA